MSKRKQGRSFPSGSASRPTALASSAGEPRGAAPVSGVGRTALLFAPVILSGALLLFAVQPLIARFVLPWFGGGPGVWTTCMLFFQALLLGGYLYAHLSVRHLATRSQVVLHVALLAATVALIPIIPSAQWKPAGSEDPVWRILLLLAATIGLPYFVLSATSPLLQAWFARVTPGVSPYRLFALSNLGSLIALIGYPTVLEPLFTRRQQAWIWSIGLIAFALGCIACAVHVWRRAGMPAVDVPAEQPERQEPAPTKSWQLHALWLALPMVASILLLAVTNTLTEDLAVFPLLWILPLAIYLLTFVIAFDGPRWYPRRATLVLLPVVTIWVIRLQLPLGATLLEQFAGYLAATFVWCLFCHGELARLKPHPRRLTVYYLAISVGGALGGVFVAIVAPRLFNRLLELPVGVLAAGFLSFACIRMTPFRHADKVAGLFIATGAFFLFGTPVLEPFISGDFPETVMERSRNFYGTLVVADIDGERPDDRLRVLNHGSTSHGAQFVEGARRSAPQLYYQEASGVAAVLRHRLGREQLRVGLVGEGAGSLAAYGKAGDTYRFYEINPDVDRLARKWFTYLSNTPAAVEVVFGDARLTLERETAPPFDVLVLDAFSGDAIPTHLLTAEAFDTYMQRLAPDGALAIHFSNRSVDLSGILLRHAHRLNLSTAVGDPSIGWWLVMTRNERLLSDLIRKQQLRSVQPHDRAPLWTDDHVNLLGVIRWLPDAPSQ